MIWVRFWLITVEGLCVEASSWEQKNIRSVPYNWWCTKLEKANNRLDSVDDFSVKTMWQVDQGQLISVFKWRRFLKDKISVRNHYVSFFLTFHSNDYILVLPYLGFVWQFFLVFLWAMKPFFCSIFSFSGLWIIKLGHVLSHKNDLSCERVPWDVVHLLT